MWSVSVHLLRKRRFGTDDFEMLEKDSELLEHFFFFKYYPSVFKKDPKIPELKKLIYSIGN